MRLTIICEDKWIGDVREKAKSISTTHVSLNTPLSPTGKFPATHWICTSYFTKLGAKKVFELKEHSIVSDSSPKILLEEMGLKIIK
jgi:hypothetical protein